MGSGFLKPPGVHLKRKRGAWAVPLAGAKLYCKVAELGLSARCPAMSCGKPLTGRHRCAGADLVVVSDLALLHDVEKLAADEDSAISFLYIVALGIDVTTQTSLAAAGFHPCRVPPRECVRHEKAPSKRTVFVVKPALQDLCPDICGALRRVSRAEGPLITASCFSALADSSCASHAAPLEGLRDVVAWACSARRVLNEFNESGPRVHGVDGSAPRVRKSVDLGCRG